MRDQAIMLHEQREALFNEQSAYESRARVEAEQQAVDALKRLKIRKRRNEEALASLLTADAEEHEAIVGSIRQHYGMLTFSIRWTEGLLSRVIFDAELRPEAGNQRLKLGWIYGRYNQTNDAHYARAEIELLQEQAQELGIRTEVEGNTVYAFVAHPVDIDIIKRTPLALKEWVRRCWKKGVNPRVYNPYLPHEFEQTNGLDYFGNETKKG